MVRKTRWGSEKAKSNIPGLPTSLPSDLSNEQIEHYIIHLRIEEINRSLRMGTYVPRHKRSVSPPPTYGPDGRRSNTREIRYRKKLEEEQHKLVEYGMKHIIGFRAPVDYKRAQQVQEKVYIPQDEYPDINFISQNLILGGSVLISTEGEVVFRTLELTAGMLPDVEGLVHAAQVLQNQSRAEEDYKEAMSPENLKMLGFDFSRVGS